MKCSTVNFSKTAVLVLSKKALTELVFHDTPTLFYHSSLRCPLVTFGASTVVDLEWVFYRSYTLHHFGVCFTMLAELLHSSFEVHSACVFI